MKISVLNPHRIDQHKGGVPCLIEYELWFDTLAELSEILIAHHICVASFSRNWRRGEYWESNDFFSADFDDGTEAETIHRFLVNKNINHLIMASKNHQKDKGDGRVVDRFHVFIPFNRPVEKEPGLYTYIAETLVAEWGWRDAVDMAATKDKVRYYYRHPRQLYLYDKGNNVSIDNHIKLYPTIKKYTPIVQSLRKERRERFIVYECSPFNNRYWKDRVEPEFYQGNRHEAAKKAISYLYMYKWSADKIVEKVEDLWGYVSPEDRKEIRRLVAHIGKFYL